MNSSVLVGGHRPEEIYRAKQEQIQKKKDLERIAREQAAAAPGPVTAPPPTNQSSLDLPVLKDSDKFFTISKVRYNGRSYEVDIWKGPTGLSLLGSQPPAPDKFYFLSAPFNFGILDTLYLLRDTPTPPPAPGVMPVCEAQALLWRTIANQPVITSTAVQYYTSVNISILPQPEDHITHNDGFGSPWEYKIKNHTTENLCGLNGSFPGVRSAIARIGSASLCELLIGVTEDRFRLISHWLTGKYGSIRSLTDRPRTGTRTKAILCLEINESGLAIDIRPNTNSWAIPMRARDLNTGQWGRP